MTLGWKIGSICSPCNQYARGIYLKNHAVASPRSGDIFTQLTVFAFCSSPSFWAIGLLLQSFICSCRSWKSSLEVGGGKKGIFLIQPKEFVNGSIKMNTTKLVVKITGTTIAAKVNKSLAIVCTWQHSALVSLRKCGAIEPCRWSDFYGTFSTLRNLKLKSRWLQGHPGRSEVCQVGQHRIVALFRFEKILKIFKSKHNPNTARPTSRPCPWAPRLQRRWEEEALGRRALLNFNYFFF